MDRISQIQSLNIEDVLRRDINTSKPINKLEDKKDFKKVLNKKISDEDIKFSKHAMQRMGIRNIEINEKDLKDINNAVKKAKAKGSRESLIMLKDIALVVSVRNKTVITAMNSRNLKENVVTNIDSAIII